MLDPLAAMAAACIAISNGEANEIELNWSQPIRRAAKPSPVDQLVIAVLGASPTTLVRRRRPVRRPQDCSCGANKLISVACWEGCASRG